MVFSHLFAQLTSSGSSAMRKSAPTDLHNDDTRQLICRPETRAEAHEKIMVSEILTLLGMDLLARPAEVSSRRLSTANHPQTGSVRGPAEAKERLRCVSKGSFGVRSGKRCRRLNTVNFVGRVGGSIPYP
jgi:hypothetical protein